MPTNSVKHQMLKEAKRIASTKFESKRIIRRDLNGSICGEFYYPSTYYRELAIKNILDEHPEFDEHDFKNMVKTIMQENKKVERDFLQ